MRRHPAATGLYRDRVAYESGATKGGTGRRLATEKRPLEVCILGGRLRRLPCLGRRGISRERV